MPKPIRKKSFVIATIRLPDGDPNGQIVEVVIDQTYTSGGSSFYHTLDRPEIEDWIRHGLLWARTPQDGNEVPVVLSGGKVRTASDNTKTNNLGEKKIFLTKSGEWITPEGRPTTSPKLTD